MTDTAQKIKMNKSYIYFLLVPWYRREALQSVRVEKLIPEIKDVGEWRLDSGVQQKNTNTRLP